MENKFSGLLLFTISFTSSFVIGMDSPEENPLQKAALDGDLLIVSQLLDQGEDPNGVLIFSPLYSALLAERWEIVDKILADPRLEIDQYAFVAAAGKGHIDIVQRALQEEDVDINEHGAAHHTALFMAQENDQTDIINLLNLYGANSDQ